jgi:putative glutathione S-transferase
MWNNKDGEFERYSSDFRQWIRSDGTTPFKPEANRYHLYISLACPWAHRTAIVRTLLGLEDIVSLSVVDPVWNDNGWTFTDYPGAIPDFVNKQQDLIDIYRLANPQYQNEETTPVLWDRQLKTIVNNESLEIIKMFASEFSALSKNKYDFYPKELRPQIDEVISSIYTTVNNGVYLAGFATSQRAYERAYNALFGALDHWDAMLGKTRYLCGRQLTLADICLFTTLFRFDFVYYSHFKCNQKHIYEFEHLWDYLRDIYQTQGVASTCNTDHIKRHYYMSQTPINPTRIVPVGPKLDYSAPHSRDQI